MSSSSRLAAFLRVVEVSDGGFLAGPLFQRKFGVAPPEEPRHFVVLYRDADGDLLPVSYVHFRPFGEVCLVGGACTDGAAIRRMSAEQQALISRDDSPYLLALNTIFARLGGEYDAFFGYCGDARALEVDLRAGFSETDHPHLLVRWNRELHPVLQRALLAKVNALGAF